VSPATWPRERHAQRLLCIDAQTATLSDRHLIDLPRLLAPGDLVVLNDAATLPASLSTLTDEGAAVELRLAGQSGERFTAVAFGAGDWQTPTEEREPAPPLRAGQVLRLRDASAKAAVRIVAIVAETPGPLLVEIVFDRSGAALYDMIYRHGRPIQYAYVDAPLSLWHVQNVFASRPWSFEPPSAAGSISWDVLFALRARGIRWTSLTHAAGLSSTGNAELDRRLPLRERYDVPEATVAAIERTRAAGGRVIAIGTTVVRALESAATGSLRAGAGETEVRLGAGSPLRVVDGVLSGMHRERTSHFELLRAFAPLALLQRSIEHATSSGYLEHEFGDACLVMRPPGAAPLDTRSGNGKPGLKRARRPLRWLRSC
jgi:S-adenosylmethionine:tRNA ribosyltransferase-isomerase